MVIATLQRPQYKPGHDNDEDGDTQSSNSGATPTAGSRDDAMTPAAAKFTVYHALLQRQWTVFAAEAERYRPSTTFLRTLTKCVVAYFVASLFTYAPLLSQGMARLLPYHDAADDAVPISNLHFIATVAVYFHPGRSVGGMVEANIFAITGFLYAIALAMSSMTLAVFLHEHDFPSISNAISVIIFVGLGTSLVGYAKVRLNRPTFNTTCSLIGVLIFTVLVKEGSSHLGHFSTDKIWQVTLVVIAGVLTSNIVCFCLWPQSATTSLQFDVQRNLRSFSTLLKLLTKAFLLEDANEVNIRSKRVQAAVDNHHTSFISLKKNLSEAKLESPFDARMRGRVESYVQVVDSLNVLAQHLGGLRTSCTLQHNMLASSLEPKRADLPVSREEQRRSSKKSDEEPSTSGEGPAIPRVQSPTGFDGSSASSFSPTAKAQQSPFEHYLSSMRPHVNSLVGTCSHTLKSLTTAFEATVSGIDSTEGYKKDVQSDGVFDELELEVKLALGRFEHERTVAIKRSYSVHPRAFAETDNMTAIDGRKSDEDVFVIFYFVFILEEFARELGHLTQALELIRKDEKQLQERRKLPWWQRLKGKASSSFGRRDRWGRQLARESFMRAVLALFSPPSAAITIPSAEPHQSATWQTPQPLTQRERIKRMVWQLGRFLKSSQARFAMKVGLGCAILASPAFISATRPAFTRYQGQWTLISFLMTLNPTLGQSNLMGVQRFVGTIFGATAAVAAYYVAPDNNIFLPILGAIFSIPCFYYIIRFPNLAPAGRLVLLTFNLTALYSYNLRKIDIEVDEIAVRRVVAVTAGVLWATILTHLVWPIEARRELTVGLSDLLFKLSFLYQKLVHIYSSKDIAKRAHQDSAALQAEQGEDPETQPLLERQRYGSMNEIQALELSLQVHLIKLEEHLKMTEHEPRLKGPFPVETYKRVIQCCQQLLDLLHTMNLVTARPDWHSRVRLDFVLPVDVSGHRRRLVGNVGLFFWLLASAFNLKTPLPPFLPPAEEARRAVIARIRELPVVKRRAIRGSSEYLLYFAYALGMKDLIHQLEEIGRLAQQLFGVVGGDCATWEDQFRPSDEERALVEEHMTNASGITVSTQSADET